MTTMLMLPSGANGANSRLGKTLLLILMSCFFVVSFLTLNYFTAGNLSERHGRMTSMTKRMLPSKTFERVSSSWSTLSNLIIVPGHGIQWCTEVGRAATDKTCWHLFDYQKGQVSLFIEHVKVGAKLARETPNSLLVFSGGQTRPGIGPRSEGQSYFAIAESLGLLEGSLYDRTVTEEFARDSLENVIFSLARFRQVTGSLPNKVTVVGFPFKERRFTELHRQAAKIALENFSYISVQLEGHNSQDATIDDAYGDFKKDLYGCGKKLTGKRTSRNPYNQQHGYKESCPELRPILSICDLLHL